MSGLWQKELSKEAGGFRMSSFDQGKAKYITHSLDIKTEKPDRADIGFVFGTKLIKPAAIAAGLIKSSVVEHVALTGGPNRLTGANEANAHLQFLLANGIPTERIIVENESTNTPENVLFSLPKIAEVMEISSIRDMIVVTKWYHCKRATMTMKRHFPEGIRYYAMSYEPDGISRENWWRTEAGRKRVLKEWRMTPDYLQKGDIAPIQADNGAFI